MRQDMGMDMAGNGRSGIVRGRRRAMRLLPEGGFFAAVILAFVLLATASLAGLPGAFGMTAEAATLSKRNLTLLKGSSAQLTVTGASGKVTWVSKKPKVAAVSKDGVVTGKKRGSAVIVAKTGGKKLKCLVHVMYAGPVETADAVKGIDVSAWQGSINFRKVKKSGIDFVIIRIGHGTEVDRYFRSNYRKAKAAGLRVGGYWFSTALSRKQAAVQRNICLKAIRGKTFDFPVFIDIEYLPQLKRGQSLTSVVIKDFCRAMKKTAFLPDSTLPGDSSGSLYRLLWQEMTGTSSGSRNTAIRTGTVTPTTCGSTEPEE